MKISDAARHLQLQSGSYRDVTAKNRPAQGKKIRLIEALEVGGKIFEGGSVVVRLAEEGRGAQQPGLQQINSRLLKSYVLLIPQRGEC